MQPRSRCSLMTGRSSSRPMCSRSLKPSMSAPPRNTGQQEVLEQSRRRPRCAWFTPQKHIRPKNTGRDEAATDLRPHHPQRLSAEKGADAGPAAGPAGAEGAAAGPVDTATSALRRTTPGSVCGARTGHVDVRQHQVKLVVLLLPLTQQLQRLLPAGARVDCSRRARPGGAGSAAEDLRKPSMQQCLVAAGSCCPMLPVPGDVPVRGAGGLALAARASAAAAHTFIVAALQHGRNHLQAHGVIVHHKHLQARRLGVGERKPKVTCCGCYAFQR